MSVSLHYTIDIDLKRKVMFSKVYGTWKKETAEDYHNDVMLSVQPLLSSKWAKLVNLSNWKSSYPEINQVIGEHMKWCREHGLSLAIYVIENPITKTQLKKMFAVGGTSATSKVVKSLAEGEKILAENGF